MKKTTRHIRITPEDKLVWKEYCKILGETSPKLFNKIIRSEELELDKRIVKEAEMKTRELKKRFLKGWTKEDQLLMW